MGAEIFLVLLGVVFFVGGWTYFFNCDEEDKYDPNSAVFFFYLIWVLLGRDRERFRILVCGIGIFFIIAPFFR